MSDKSGSPPCGIYLRIDDFSNMLDVIGHIRKMAFAINRGSGYEKNMTIIELVLTGNNKEKIIDLVQIVKDQGIVCLIGGDTSALDMINADGLILKNANNIEQARQTLGEDAIIGLNGETKSNAEKVKDADIDIIFLPADPTLISWWQSQSEIICVADGNGITASMCGALATAGASFVNVSEYVLTHPKDIMQGTVNVLDALNKSTAPPQSLN